MTHVDTSRLSPYHQAFIKKQAHMSEAQKKPRVENPKPAAYGEEFDSMLELDFAHELERWQCNRTIFTWFYHLLRFRIAKNVTYTPDFFTLAGSRPTWSVYEVKGSWQAKNARDSRTKLQVAAYMVPWFNWYAATREQGIWQFETIHSTDAEEE